MVIDVPVVIDLPVDILRHHPGRLNRALPILAGLSCRPALFITTRHGGAALLESEKIVRKLGGFAFRVSECRLIGSNTLLDERGDLVL